MDGDLLAEHALDRRHDAAVVARPLVRGRRGAELQAGGSDAGDVEVEGERLAARVHCRDLRELAVQRIHARLR